MISWTNQQKLHHGQIMAIVTVKLKNVRTNEKQTGKCPVSDYCTDKNGGHHSYLETGDSIEDIERSARTKYSHITRIEVCNNYKVGQK